MLPLTVNKDVYIIKTHVHRHVLTMEIPVEKCVAAVTVVASGCDTDDGSLRRISTMWFAGMSDDICMQIISHHLLKHRLHNS